jgi:hypothetical protein
MSRWRANATRRREAVPQIIVKADKSSDRDGDDAVMLRERISPADFESHHFQAQLVERLGWAVVDADAAERRLSASAPTS